MQDITRTLSRYFTEKDIQSAERCAARLINCLPTKKRLSDNCIFLAYGGGKDSSYMVAYVRYIQGLVLQRYGDTFSLRISTNRHAGMNTAVIENIDRVYQALAKSD